MDSGSVIPERLKLTASSAAIWEKVWLCARQSRKFGYETLTTPTLGVVSFNTISREASR